MPACIRLPPARSLFKAWGNSASVDRLVPLSVGVDYEENPTISYTPLQGELVLRRLTSPIGVDEGFLLMSYARDRNELYDSGVMQFGLAPESRPEHPRYALIMSNYNDAEAVMIREYLNLLGVYFTSVDGGPISIPIGPNSLESDEKSLSVMTRSVYSWLQLAGSMIELPPPHVREGILDPEDNWTGPSSDRLITIRSSPGEPDNATVAIQFNDWWFYIADGPGPQYLITCDQRTFWNAVN